MREECTCADERKYLSCKVHGDSRPSYGELEAELSATKQKLEAAESRIKASQEQEPDFVDFEAYGYASDCARTESWRKEENWSKSEFLSIIGEDWERNDTIRSVIFHHYAAPIIPPEIAELQRKVDRAHAAQQDAEQRELDCCHDLDAAVAKNAELTRKLSEGYIAVARGINSDLSQQVEMLTRKLAEQELQLDDLLCGINAVGAGKNDGWKDIERARNYNYSDELTKLLAESKSDAVPEFSTFNEWMHKEIPSGTIIGDAGWWASRIYRKFIAPATSQPDRGSNG